MTWRAISGRPHLRDPLGPGEVILFLLVVVALPAAALVPLVAAAVAGRRTLAPCAGAGARMGGDTSATSGFPEFTSSSMSTVGQTSRIIQIPLRCFAAELTRAWRDGRAGACVSVGARRGTLQAFGLTCEPCSPAIGRMHCEEFG